ncbi:bile salt-activated lipase-like [Erythrolamprus reginae]|uniref:bile salt-activated lipase-like n=1 Tax=Erythrolamprus reginae TaxID=121349 RepID=UPI00396D00E6
MSTKEKEKEKPQQPTLITIQETLKAMQDFMFKSQEDAAQQREAIKDEATQQREAIKSDLAEFKTEMADLKADMGEVKAQMKEVQQTLQESEDRVKKVEEKTVKIEKRMDYFEGRADARYRRYDESITHLEMQQGIALTWRSRRYKLENLEQATDFFENSGISHLDQSANQQTAQQQLVQQQPVEELATQQAQDMGAAAFIAEQDQGLPLVSCLQTLSPYNKGLIKRAISQSGVGLCTWAIQKDPLFWAIKVAHKVGCPTDNTTVLANCLRVTDPKTLTLAYHLELTNLRYPLVHYLAFAPVVDGDFIPDVPKNLFTNAADVDYVLGVNDMDGHFFAGIDMPSINRPLVSITPQNVYRLIQGLTVEKGAPGADVACALYTQVWSNTEDQEVMKRTVVDLETDYMFLVPTQQALQLHQANAKSSKTYSYVFSEPSRMPFIYPAWVGADHADDIQYVFGKPFATPLGYKPRHRKLSKAMIAYWTNFARTGDPNQGESEVPIAWVPYNNNDSAFYLDINHDINYDSVKQGLRAPYVNFWNVGYHNLPDVRTAAKRE